MQRTNSTHIQIDPAEAVQTIRRRTKADANRRRILEENAHSDLQRIVRMIIADFSPRSIYQWGSLTRPGAFREFSDIDLAVEGVTDPARFFSMLGKCMELTDFPVDLVQLECINPLHAEEIRTHGQLLWEAAS